MSHQLFCQSCSMPMDGPELLGSEADGSTSEKYCKYCYHNGAFTHPGITLEEMKKHMMQIMDGQAIPADIVEAAIKRLPLLERWKNEVPIIQ